MRGAFILYRSLSFTIQGGALKIELDATLYIWYNRMKLRTEIEYPLPYPVSHQYHWSIFFTSGSKFDLRQASSFKLSSASSLRLLREFFMLKFSNVCALDCFIWFIITICYNIFGLLHLPKVSKWWSLKNLYDPTNAIWNYLLYWICSIHNSVLITLIFDLQALVFCNFTWLELEGRFLCWRKDLNIPCQSNPQIGL